MLVNVQLSPQTGVSSHSYCPLEPKTLGRVFKSLLEASVLGMLPSLVWGLSLAREEHHRHQRLPVMYPFLVAISAFSRECHLLPW